MTEDRQDPGTPGPVDTDVETLKLIAGGGRPAEKAVAVLFKKYRKPLLGFLLQRGVDPHLAQDIVQEAFIKVVKHACTFRQDSKVSSWIYTVVRNTHIDFLRRVNPEINLDDEGWAIVGAKQPADKSSDPSQSLEQSQLHDCLERQYGQFASEHPAAAAALQGVTEHDWSIRDLAEFLGRTEAATKQYMYQCRKRLKVYFEPCRERWGSPS